jgi:hypothetical protein
MKLFQTLFLPSIILAQFLYAQSSGVVNREFSSADDFAKANSVRLPKPVLAALLATKEADAGREWVHNNPGEDSNSLDSRRKGLRCSGKEAVDGR